MKRNVKTRSLENYERGYKPSRGSSLLFGGLIGGIFRFIGQKIWQLIYPLLVSIALSILAIVAGTIYEYIKKTLSQKQRSG